MKKKVMNIRPQEVTVDGERSVQYKGSDGKFHGIAPDGGNTAQSYAVVNNPNAYELVFSGQYVGGGQKKFNAYTCDEAKTEISASELVDIIVADPNTTIIFRTKGSGSYERIVLLHPNQIHADLSEVRLEGTLAGNKTDVIDAYVNKTSNEIRLFVNNA